MTRLTRYRGIALAAVMVLAGSGGALACDFEDAPGQLDVGVVFSGGGAMSATQVGALSVIEEAGVPIHCVVGTSMGAVVAGLYGAGYDADEMDHFFSDADWAEIITGQGGYRYESFRDKELDEKYFSDYVAGFDDDGLRLPGGYQSLRKMRLFLRNLTTDVGHISDFDDMPTPFRTVGTDLDRFEGITLGEGDLVDAMLASMAVPGVYPAVEYGDYILVDGGMSKQVGIDVIREMGADVVIVIDTTVLPPEYDEVPNIAATIQQMIQVTVWKNWKEQIALLQPGDIHIQPDLTGLSSSNFDALRLGYDRGVSRAREYTAELVALKQRAAPPTRWKPQRLQTHSLAQISVTDTAGVDSGLIQRRFGIGEGETVSAAEIEQGIRNVEALGAFGQVDYSLTPVGDGSGRENVEIRTTPRPLGRNAIQAGARFSSTFDGFADYGLVGRWSRQPINRAGGEISVAVEVGSDLSVLGEWYQPFGPGGKMFFAPYGEYVAYDTPVQIDTIALNENWIQRATAGARLGRELGQWGQVSADFFVTRTDSEPKFDPDGLERLLREQLLDEQVEAQFQGQTLDYQGIELRFASDTLNSLSFPTSGYSLDVSGAYLEEMSNELADPDLVVVEADASLAAELAGIGLYARLRGGSVDNGTDPATAFYLGGFKNISGARDESIPATEYTFGSVEAYKRLTSVRNVTGVAIYVGGTVEYADVEFDSSVLRIDGDIFAGSIYGAVETPIGPAYIAYGQAEGGRQSVYFFFGHTF